MGETGAFSKPREMQFPLHRLTLSALEWGDENGEIVVALHGWLDNAASFIPLASRLNLNNKRLIAVDLPGHGLSGHRAAGENYHFLDYVQDIVELLERLHKPVCLIGHSLGGAIASIVSAIVPDNVKKLVMLDALGPMVAKEEQTLANLKHAVDYLLRTKTHKIKPIESVEKAVRIRMTGLTSLKSASARLLVERAIMPVEGGYFWRSAPGLKAPSLSRLTEGQVRNIFEGIPCPVCLIAAEDGLFKFDHSVQTRLSYFRNLTLHKVVGGHHFHMDGDVDHAAGLINVFLEQHFGCDQTDKFEGDAK